MRKKRRWDEEFCKMCEKKGGLGGKLGCFAVAPYAGAWIEIEAAGVVKPTDWVAPYAGAWIEIIIFGKVKFCINVAPYAGAWIEISAVSLRQIVVFLSLPTRERGLKSA